ncbi:MAG: ABC transporter substrate-binding protein [Burkholderiales bacterium]|nr:ABC transporter substrate-binding protein [Burkholderiales bacterium]
MTTEDYPPFNIADPKNEEVSGISTDKVRELMRRAGETYSLRAYPWARAFQMAQQNTNTCVFSTTRTPEREPMFKWVGPLVKNNWVVFARADDHRHPKNLEELRPYVLGAYRKDAVGEFLITKGFKIELANVDADNPRKLLYRRFDFWATGELLGLSILKQQNLIGQIVPLFQFQQTELYLACHPDVPQQRIDLFNQLLLEMEKDGTVKAIEKRYQ